MRGVFAFVVALCVAVSAYGQEPPTFAATVQAAGQHVDGGTAVSLLLKNTGPKPARFMLVEFHGVSPVLILPNANVSNGVYQGIEACSVPASSCLARNRGWMDLAPGEDIMVAIAFKQLPYASGRGAINLQVVAEVDGKRSTVPLNVRSVTLP